VTISGNTLFGTARAGGTSGVGTVFAIKTDGSGFKVLHTFDATKFYEPSARLVLSGNMLYGTTSGGGGDVFALQTDGTGFRSVHSLSDGYPTAGVTLSGNTLYGTTDSSGSGGNGTVFKVNTNGTGFTTLHNFSALDAFQHNSDGSDPRADLVLSGDVLYGAASSGGRFGGGTVFKVNTDGTGFSTLAHGWDVDHFIPNGLVLSGNTLYGTFYGDWLFLGPAFGSVFSISLPITTPQLTITPSEANVILSWPTNFTGFTLQSTTNLGSSAIWSTNLPAPVVVNGQYAVTNPISGTRQFFRLKQ
jgi:uncharacterized repeat protein (TIGR03803 family)